MEIYNFAPRPTPLKNTLLLSANLSKFFLIIRLSSISRLRHKNTLETRKVLQFSSRAINTYRKKPSERQDKFWKLFFRTACQNYQVLYVRGIGGQVGSAPACYSVQLNTLLGLNPDIHQKS